MLKDDLFVGFWILFLAEVGHTAVLYLQYFPCQLHLKKLCVCVCFKSLQSCPTLCNPVDGSSPGSSVYGILQARILEWVVMPSFRGSSWPWNRTSISQCLLHWGQILYRWTTWEVYDRHKLFYHQTIPLLDIYPSNLLPDIFRKKLLLIKKKCITNTHNKMKEFKGLCWAKHTRHKRVHIVSSNQS